MKLINMVNLDIELRLLSQEKGISFATAFKVNRMMNVIKPHVEAFNTSKEFIVRKYGKDDGNGGVYVDESNENYKLFLEEIQPVFQEEIEFTPDNFKLSDFEGVKNSGYNEIFQLID